VNDLRFFKPNKADAFASYSHLAGALMAVIGAVALIWRAAPDLWLALVAAVYGAGAILMLLASGLYHGYKRAENQSGILRKLDHIGIFIMIAGTYTPLCYVYLTGGMRWGIIAAQWALVLAGFFQSIYFIKAPRVVITLIYLAMGWMVVIPIKQIFTAMDPQSIIFLVAGGLAYTVGAVIYMLKKPNPAPGVFGFHEIFHVFILIGVLCHYIVILGAVRSFV